MDAGSVIGVAGVGLGIIISGVAIYRMIKDKGKLEAKLEHVCKGQKPILLAVLAILLKLKDEKINGEMEDALKAVNEHLASFD